MAWALLHNFLLSDTEDSYPRIVYVMTDPSIMYT